MKINNINLNGLLNVDKDSELSYVIGKNVMDTNILEIVY